MSKVAIVTGASGGLGGAILAALVTAGYHVMACGRDLSKLVGLSETYGDCISIKQIDFTKTTRAALHRDTFAHASLLVCAHGAAPCVVPTLHLTAADFWRIFHADVYGSLLMAQVVGAGMVERRTGSMVFISSAHAYQTYPRRVPYAIAKSAVVAMARALAVEWGPYGITVNSISPWQVSGPRSEAIAAQEGQDSGIDTLELYRQRSPLRRLVTPEDVAKAVLFLAENTSISGQDVRLDCAAGASMWHRGFEAVDG